MIPTTSLPSGRTVPPPKWDDVIDKPAVLTDKETSYSIKALAGIGCLAALVIFVAWVIYH